MSDTAGLVSLFLSSFLGATLLPGGSVVVLFALLKSHPESVWWALALATAVA
ncbi:MAG: DedA family protein, partial [Pseudomonadota bacterium]